MVTESDSKEHHDKPSVLRVILILLFPIAFIFIAGVVGEFTENFGVFFVNSITMFYILLASFPLSWAYLMTRFVDKKMAVNFAKITTLFLTPFLLAAAVMSSVSVAPLISINKDFTTPAGWEQIVETDDTNDSITAGKDIFGCPFMTPECPKLMTRWEINHHLTLNDLQEVARVNGFKDFAIITDSCEKVLTTGISCDLAGEVNGTKVKLWYSNNKYDSTSEVRLKLYGKDVPTSM